MLMKFSSLRSDEPGVSYVKQLTGTPCCFFQIRKQDFTDFDIIFGMDEENME